MELQRRYADITRQGLGLVAISYDRPDTLKKFSESRGITFPLISDTNSATIRSFGILNQSEKPGSRSYGIPHPGTFIVDRRGRVLSRFFEDAYQERYTVSAMLSMLGAPPAIKASTAHLSVTASLSELTAAPGERVALTATITPNRGIHVYAPGKHDYQVVRLTVEPQPWLRLHDTTYPKPEIYHFKPLDEYVEVFVKPFQLRRDVTLLATSEAQKLLAAQATVTINASLEYQACDDRVCFNPTRVPLSLTLNVRALDRRPPGGH